MKKQVFIVHGADTFDTYEEYLKFLNDWKIDFEGYRNLKIDWKKTLGARLGDDYEVIYPEMPNKINAKYFEWKIWFEKFIPFLNNEVILLGHSMGGIFLAKYLSENNFPKKVKGLFMAAAPFDEKDSEFSLADFNLTDQIGSLADKVEKIFLYQSEDDTDVPLADVKKYQKILPDALTRIFTDRGHFRQEEFPELVEDIRSVQ